MDRELWKQVDALLEQALEQPPEEREVFVAKACPDNEVVRAEVLSLLRAQSQAAQFMERSALNVAAHALAQDSNITTIASLVGQDLEGYRIEKLLGARAGWAKFTSLVTTSSVAWWHSKSCRCTLLSMAIV